MKNEKYELVYSDEIFIKNIRLRRIRAIIDFGDVKAGDLGGYVQSEKNLNIKGSCWIYDNAKVYGHASVRNRAKVKSNAIIYDNAIITDRAFVSGECKVYGNAEIKGNAWVDGNSRITGKSTIAGDGRITDNVHIHGSVYISDQVIVKGNSLIYGRTRLRKSTVIKDMSLANGNINYSIKDNNFDNFMYINAHRKEITVIKTESDLIMLDISGYITSIVTLKSDIKNDILPESLGEIGSALNNLLLYLEVTLG